MNEGQHCVLNINKICRICLSEEGPMSSIFNEATDVECFSLAMKLMTCTSVKIHEGDGLPALVCQHCMLQLNNLYSFKLQCENSDTTLQEYLSKINSTTKKNEDFEEDDIQDKSNSKFHGKPTNKKKIFENSDMKLEPLCIVEEDSALSSEVKDETLKLEVVHTEQVTSDMGGACSGSEEEQSNSTEEEFNDESQVQSTNKTKARSKLFTCPECLRAFSSRTYLKDHQATHSGKKQFSCKDCRKSFFSERKLKIHSKTHSVDRSCLCNICGKLFCEKSDLKKHFQSHSEESPFLCNVCGKTFKTKFYLSRHMMIHSGEKRFVCPICQRSFTWKDTLLAHAKVHTGERPLPCNVCTKTFKRKEDLTRHMRIHTGERPFVCSFCNRCFSDKWNLTQHIRLHTGAKPYVCTICNEAFTHNVTLRNHAKHSHLNLGLDLTAQTM